MNRRDILGLTVGMPLTLSPMAALGANVKRMAKPLREPECCINLLRECPPVPWMQGYSVRSARVCLPHDG